MKILLATSNRGKITEMKELLADLDLEILTLADDFPSLNPPDEGVLSFRFNALGKAGFAAISTGVLAIADDSGLEVDALAGQPGVRSARYARVGATDKENYTKLIKVLKDIPPGQRRARFRCVIGTATPNGRDERSFEGILEGVITDSPRGSGGFGYDPIFEITGTEKTLAEMTSDEKNKISHRGEALKELKEYLKELLEEVQTS
ncbi:Nucleoside 5-triphosphatase RdgB (dHAPTP, dITP, XTP-specific) [hydrothermal vent metagenome]|uniref:dITP/XTP pyrophosphatase n=1 Tax=hydrothermal vent metagenome TaxID=652676 RepID=A0A3B0QNM0_9ZZZZ